eukprot:CAMPEP_0180043308 /NCGR_PEP_ID=MMETSP0984-20121128/35253_1 /TAXON_ID=483367 /ORGANISM="non described non described, Strain CCMP 2436" /LENGTH=255 /DNA_ID=CAMNT_0021971265 /DNA_START=134 /DNA_END=896 /DNA_ORIENTATION=+
MPKPVAAGELKLTWGARPRAMREFPPRAAVGLIPLHEHHPVGDFEQAPALQVAEQQVPAHDRHGGGHHCAAEEHGEDAHGRRGQMQQAAQREQLALATVPRAAGAAALGDEHEGADRGLLVGVEAVERHPPHAEPPEPRGGVVALELLEHHRLVPDVVKLTPVVVAAVPTHVAHPVAASTPQKRDDLLALLACDKRGDLLAGRLVAEDPGVASKRALPHAPSAVYVVVPHFCSSLPLPVDSDRLRVAGAGHAELA